MFLTLTISSKVQPREYFKDFVEHFPCGVITVWPARKCIDTEILKVDRAPQAKLTILMSTGELTSLYHGRCPIPEHQLRRVETVFTLTTEADNIDHSVLSHKPSHFYSNRKRKKENQGKALLFCQVSP